jgi:hypothetical protein
MKQAITIESLGLHICNARRYEQAQRIINDYPHIVDEIAVHYLAKERSITSIARLLSKKHKIKLPYELISPMMRLCGVKLR